MSEKRAGRLSVELGRLVAGWAMVVGLSLPAVSCRSTRPDLPTLDDVAPPRKQTPAPGDIAGPGSPLSQETVAAVADVVLMDLPQGAEKGLSELSSLCPVPRDATSNNASGERPQDAYPEEGGHAAWKEGTYGSAFGPWAENGVYVGVVEPGQVDAVGQLLAGAENVRRMRATLRDGRWTRLVAGPVGDGVTVFRPIGQNGAITEPWSGGRCQLLARWVSGKRINNGRTVEGPLTADGAGAIELMPHYFKPRPSAWVRSSFEKSLDGRVFDELTLQVPLKHGQWLVVFPLLESRASLATWGDDPTPDDSTRLTPIEPAEPESPGGSPDQISDPARDDAARTEPMIGSQNGSTLAGPGDQSLSTGFERTGDSFGDHLLRASRYRKPVVTVVLISVTPIPATAVDRGPGGG